MEGLVPGRIVYFVFDQASADHVAYDRTMAASGGNPVRAGDIVPAMVVRVWDASSGTVNLKVMLDGPDTCWATSVAYSAPAIETQSTPERPAGVVHQRRTWHWMYADQATRGSAR